MGSQNETEPTILIIGAGVFGASTAYHLSRRYNDSSRITVVDRSMSPPAVAASTDINKIIRADYSSPLYCDLAYEAIRAWATWPELKDYYHRTGWIMLDGEDSDLAERIRNVFKSRHHDPTKDVPLQQLDRLWNGIMEGTDFKGLRDAYFNTEAGWCDAASATASLMEAAIERGVKYIVGGDVQLALDDEKVSGVKLADGDSLSAEKIVVATGAWTSNLLSPIEDDLDIATEDRVERQVSAAGVAVARYKMSPSEMEQLSKMPVVVYGENGEVIPPPRQNQLLKYTNARSFSNTITTKSGHKISVPPGREQCIVPEKLKRETEENMMSKVMPHFARNKEAEYWRLCWDARTPTQDWLLCRHPHTRLNNLYLATGGSFHSYKFLPTIGTYVVKVISGEGNGEDMDKAWGWKTGESRQRGIHEKTAPKRELRDLEAGP